MRTKILMLVMLMSCSAVVIAQTADNDSTKSFRGQNREMRMNDHQRGPKNGHYLTDAQRDAFKKSRFEMQKQLQPLKNVLGELKAHQKTLITIDQPDMNDINKNIEKMGSLNVEMAKIMAQHRIDTRAQLTDEQRLMFDMHKGKMMQQHGPQGMRPGRGMHKGNPMN